MYFQLTFPTCVSLSLRMDPYSCPLIYQYIDSVIRNGIIKSAVSVYTVPHYNVPWWRHQMETFSALLAICVGTSPVPGEFPTQGQWRGALIFYLICVWINDWVNNREAGDLRSYCAHYDVTVMLCNIIWYTETTTEHPVGERLAFYFVSLWFGTSRFTDFPQDFFTSTGAIIREVNVNIMGKVP